MIKLTKEDLEIVCRKDINDWFATILICKKGESTFQIRDEILENQEKARKYDHMMENQY